MAETVFYDVDELTYNSDDIDGVLSISIEDTSEVVTACGDDGVAVHHVPSCGEVIGTIIVKDAVAAKNLSMKSRDSKNITCKVKNASGDWYLLTLTDAKTGGFSATLATPAQTARVLYKASGFSLVPD